MEKRYAIIPNKLFDKIVANFVDLFGLPEIQRKLSTYTYDNKGNQLHINFVDQRCDIKYVPAIGSPKTTTPLIFVENKNLKQLFETVSSLGFGKVNVGLVVSLNFDVGNIRIYC